MSRRAVELGGGPGALAFEDFGIAGGGGFGLALCGTSAVSCALAASAIGIGNRADLASIWRGHVCCATAWGI